MHKRLPGLLSPLISSEGRTKAASCSFSGRKGVYCVQKLEGRGEKKNKELWNRIRKWCEWDFLLPPFNPLNETRCHVWQHAEICSAREEEDRDKGALSGVASFRRSRVVGFGRSCFSHGSFPAHIRSRILSDWSCTGRNTQRWETFQMSSFLLRFKRFPPEIQPPVTFSSILSQYNHKILLCACVRERVCHTQVKWNLLPLVLKVTNIRLTDVSWFTPAGNVNSSSFVCVCAR